MKKSKELPEKPQKDKLFEGDKIFYYDGISQWTIEVVESIDRPNKKVKLSNNAIISRYASPNGTYEKDGITKPLQYIVKLTPELEKLRTAIICKRKIERIIFELQQTVLKKADTRDWKKWSNAKQESLIRIAGHLAKALEEEELDQEDLKALNNLINK